jgi:hypothetical protein
LKRNKKDESLLACMRQIEAFGFSHKANQGVPERDVKGESRKRRRPTDYAGQNFQSDNKNCDSFLAEARTLKKKMIE